MSNSQDLRAEINRLRDALENISLIYQRSSIQSNHLLAQAAYDMHCVAREALGTNQIQQEQHDEDGRARNREMEPEPPTTQEHDDEA